jgi:hypothetical protein
MARRPWPRRGLPAAPRPWSWERVVIDARAVDGRGRPLLGLVADFG